MADRTITFIIFKMCIGFVCLCVFVYFFTGGCECFLSRALLSGSHYVLSLCHCVTLLCYSPDVEQIKMMMMMITPCNVAGS